jgi:hypothetical protein
MLSQTLSQLLERARARFGLEVEILDPALRSVYPEGPSEFGQVVAGSPGLRRTLLDAMVAGRPQDVQQAGSTYRVYPLRHSRTRRQAFGLLAVKRAPGRGIPEDVEPWSELARAIVEADLASLDSLREERQHSRQQVGVLKLLELLNDAPDERSLAYALVQAAAVWYDADARVYRRSLAGDYVLHTCLPGVRAEDRVARVSARACETDRDVRRLVPSHEFGAATSLDAVVVPLAGSGSCEWVLVVLGVVPPAAESPLRVVGRVGGSRLEALAAAHAQACRRHFENVASQPAPAPELAAMRIVHELVHRAGAASGALTLIKGSEARRIAAVGPQPDRPEEAWQAPGVHAERIVTAMALDGDQRGILELRAASGVELAVEAAALCRACADVVRPWLSGTLLSLNDTTRVLDGVWVDADFSVRITEELERAKRFDLGLALILVDVPAAAADLTSVQAELRRELRGSDVLGATGARQLAALLTHTDGIGLDTVVERLKLRLADTAERLNVAGLRLGRAAMSADCRTAEALLTEAALSAEPVIIH